MSKLSLKNPIEFKIILKNYSNHIIHVLKPIFLDLPKKSQYSLLSGQINKINFF